MIAMSVAKTPSSGMWVLDETTEVGRLYHIGIVLGKKNFSVHHYKQNTLCTVIRVMPLFFLSLSLQQLVLEY